MRRRTEIGGLARLSLNHHDNDGPLYTVSQLAEELGLTPRAVQFYESKGLISPRRAGSVRVYTEQEKARLVLIQRGKRLGFTLQDIKEYLQLYEPGGSDPEQRAALLEAVRARIRQLEAQSAAISLTLAELGDIERRTVQATRMEPRRKAS